MTTLAAHLRGGLGDFRAGVARAPSTLAKAVRDPRAFAPDVPAAAVAILYTHFLLDHFDATGFGVILPEIRRAFGLDLQGVTAIAAIAALSALLAAVPVAYLADRTRRRIPLLAAGAGIAAVATGGAAGAGTLVAFVCARTALGIGLKINDPVQQSLLADYSPIAQRPAVYTGRHIARSFGGVAGPLCFGGVAALAGWRAALVASALPIVALTIVTLRLREPSRGGQERRAMGVGGADADVEEEPPRWEEAVEIVRGVRSVRRLWYALPFLVGGLASLVLLFPLYLDEVFGVGPAGRGILGALDEPFGVAGMLMGIPVAARILRSETPEALFRLLGLLGVGIAACLVVMTTAPNLTVFVVARLALALLGTFIVPGFATLFSLVLPPRARSVGFALSSLWGIPGLLILPIVGALGDEYGLRIGLFAAVPVFLIGAAILSSAGQAFRTDMQANLMRAMAALEDRRARAEGRTKLLVCRGVEVCYGSTQVLFGVDFDVEEGEMVALLGTNGAGKSTLLRAISGTVQPSGGAIFLDGRDITRAAAARTAEMGVVHVPGGRGVFPSLTVQENLALASWLFRSERERVAGALDEVLDLFPVLRDRLTEKAGNLSGGEQQMLTLAQAFIARPRLLMIDELSLGLAPALVQQLLDVVRAIHSRGTTVVLVEQSVNVALTVCERAVFLEKGEIRFEGPVAGLLGRTDVLRSVFLHGTAGTQDGAKRAAARRRSTKRASAKAPVLLEGRGLRKSFGGITAVDDLDIGVSEGQVVGLIGANGAGKTTVFDLLSGFLPPDQGDVRLAGEDVTRWPASRRARSGLGRSFQSAHLFPSLTVAEVIAVALDRHVDVRDPMSTLLGVPAARHSENEVARRVDELIDLLGLGAFRDKFVSELSTGTRRIVDIACALAHRPTVLLLDEPSSGIAQREAEALGPLLLKVRDETGAALLVIEHDMPLISAISDRIVALAAGRLIAEGTPRSVLTDPRVVASYLGTDDAVIARSGRRRRVRSVVTARSSP